MNKLMNVAVIVAGYVLLSSPVIACSTSEEVRLKASSASSAIYSLPDDLMKEYEALNNQAFGLQLDDKMSEACALYDQIIQSIEQLKASGKVCTSEQILSKTEYLWSIAPQLNNLSANLVELFRVKIDRVNAMVQAGKNVEACALYDEIFSDAEKLGIKK